MAGVPPCPLAPPRALVWFALFAALLGSRPARASSVTELVREAREQEAAHRDDLAARRYTEALSLDPTCEEAYLGLGELRARLGDAREAERVYSVALAHAPQLKLALVGRARARRALGQRDEAEEDLEAYVLAEGDPAVLRELAGWYGEDNRAAAELATWRRMLVIGVRAHDPTLARESMTMVRALQLLLGPADPVTGPLQPGISADRAGAPREFARRMIAVIARRGG